MAIHRPLSALTINVSISESDESAKLGFPLWQINRVTLQIVSALFGQGVAIAFGHDWRSDGVMEAIYGYARQVQPPIPLASDEATAQGQPQLFNLLPWPDAPSLSRDDLDRYRSTLRVEAVELPEALRRHVFEARLKGADSDLYLYLRARGLTELRLKLTDFCDARLCLGGRRGGSSGRFPGVVEEALLAVQHNKPLYVAGILGGASRQIAQALLGAPMPDDFCDPRRSIAHRLYHKPPRQESPEAASDIDANRSHAWNQFTKLGLAEIARINRLSEDENLELFHTPVLERVIDLVLIGLSRVKAAIEK